MGNNRIRSAERLWLRLHSVKSELSLGTRAIRPMLMPLLLLSLFPSSSQAQGGFTFTHREFEVSLFGGASFAGSGSYATPVTGTDQNTSRNVGLRYGSGYYTGARISDNRWQHWGTAFEYGYSNQPATFANLSDSIPTLSLGHSIHHFAYEVLYYPLRRDSRWRPYGFAGPGVSLFYVKASSKDAAAAQGIILSDPWKVTTNWGGGVKYLLRDQVAASFQFSDSMSGVPGYGLPKNGSMVSGQYVPGFHPDGLIHNWLISVGFHYQWGER